MKDLGPFVVSLLQRPRAAFGGSTSKRLARSLLRQVAKPELFLAALGVEPSLGHERDWERWRG